MRDKYKSLNKNIEEQNKEINNLKIEIKARDEKIKEQNKEINNLKIENKDTKDKIKDQNKEINILHNENKLFDKKIDEQNKKIIYIISKSIILKPNRVKLILSEIEKRMNKEISGLNKLYQATIDGADPVNFHKKCDNIPNTLVLIKSKGQRTFGGFTKISWKSEKFGKHKKDRENTTFIFSLDNKKIYNLQDIDYPAVYHNKNYGPCFGMGDIGIVGNPIKEYGLYTIPNNFDCKGEKNPLSECVSNDGIKLLEYEVFQVLFD